MKQGLFHSALVLMAMAASFGPFSARADDKSFGPVTRPVIDDVVKPQMKDGFGAEFWIIDDNQNVEKWFPEDLRGLHPAYITIRHKTLRLLVFLLDPGHQRVQDRDGNENVVSDVTYDLAIVQPDGVIKDTCKGVAGWTGPSPSPHLMHIAKATLKLSFEALDPLGTYTMAIVVHDNVRKVDIPLSHTIKLRDTESKDDPNKKWNTSLGP